MPSSPTLEPLRAVHALVTGANRGLGLEVARQLCQRGYVVWAGARDPGAVPPLGDAVRPLRLDVTDPASVTAVRAGLDRLDLLVNNAAILGPDESVLDANFTSVREVMETNTFGPWRLAAACADLLRASPHGRIVNVSSGMGALDDVIDLGPDRPTKPAYRISKLGLNWLTRMLADELREDGVLVNAICPGWLATDMGRTAGEPPRSAAEGAATVLWAATLPDDGPTGGFCNRDPRSIRAGRRPVPIRRLRPLGRQQCGGMQHIEPLG